MGKNSKKITKKRESTNPKTSFGLEKVGHCLRCSLTLYLYDSSLLTIK